MDSKKKNDGGRGRGRGRGERGGRPQTAVQRDDDDGNRKPRGGTRPQTARGGQGGGRGGNEFRDRDGGKRGGGNRGRGGRGGANEEGGVTMHGAGSGGKRSYDESSWQAKYLHGERPKLDENVVVTVDTKIPELPPASKIVKKPRREDFQKKMRELDDRAAELRESVAANRRKRSRVYSDSKVDGADTTYREVLTSNIEEVKKVRAQQKGHLDKLNALKERQRELEAEKAALLKNVPRNYHTQEDLQQAIQEKQQRYETSSLANAEERRLLRDIDTLRRAQPEMKKLEVIEPELAQIREKKKAVTQDLDKVKQVIAEKNEKIDSVKKEENAQKNKRGEVRDAAEKFTPQIEKDNEELTQIYKTKDAAREDYFKALYEFEVQSEYVHHVRRMMGRQKELKARQEERTKRIEQKKADIEAIPNPLAEEIETCQDLIKYCQKLKAQAGLAPPTSEQVAIQAQADLYEEQRRADFEQKLKDGKIQAAQSKKDDTIVVGGGGKGKKGKKQRNQQTGGATAQSSAFSIGYDQVRLFGVVRLSPPLGNDDLDGKIEALKKKEQEYIEEGEARLKQEKTDREQLIEQDVDAELERERQAAQDYGDEGYYDEEDGYDEGRDAASKGPARPGNRGPGAAGERDRKRGGDPRKRKGKDFQGSDEDEEEEKAKPAFKDPYAKPTRGGGQQVNQGKRGGKQGKKGMDLDDEEDFPAL